MAFRVEIGDGVGHWAIIRDGVGREANAWRFIQSIDKSAETFK
jgi:hypothetical protein